MKAPRAVIVLLVVIMAASAVALVLWDGDGGAYGGEIEAPVSSDSALGMVELTDSSDGSRTYRAVAVDGVFIGWFEDGTLVSSEDTVVLTSPRGLTALFEESENRTVTLQWRCPVFGDDGSPMADAYVRQTLVMELSRTAYYESLADASGRQATYADPMPVHRLSDCAAVDAVVEHLEPLVDGLTNLQKAEVVLAFVQDAISYGSDQSLYGTIEFWATPMETLFLGSGDCEDTAALFVNIAARMGLDVGFVAFDDPVMGHMSAAVALEEGETVDGAVFVTSDGARWAYCETAVDGARLHVGYLTDRFDIDDGQWTHVTYDPETGSYTGANTVPIGVVSTGSLICRYG